MFAEMFSKPIQELVEFFLEFPGVGPKQAARFVFYLLRADSGRVQELASAIARLREEVRLCTRCYKSFDANHGGQDAELCELCRNSRRNARQVMVVEKEADLENIERTGKYDGLYHVLGGTVDPLDSAAPGRLHLRELHERVKALLTRDEPTEVILATNPTAEGDTTALYVERILAPLRGAGVPFAISRLGRGLTTGSELEYSDDVTIANALENRK